MSIVFFEELEDVILPPLDLNPFPTLLKERIYLTSKKWRRRRRSKYENREFIAVLYVGDKSYMPLFFLFFLFFFSLIFCATHFEVSPVVSDCGLLPERGRKGFREGSRKGVSKTKPVTAEITSFVRVVVCAVNKGNVKQPCGGLDVCAELGDKTVRLQRWWQKFWVWSYRPSYFRNPRAEDVVYGGRQFWVQTAERRGVISEGG